MPLVVHIEEIVPGMVLGAPILNRYGQTLLAQGITIDEKHLLMFKTWGIRHISVEGPKDKDAKSVSINEDLLRLARMHVQKRMLWEISIPIEEDLFNTAAEHVIDIYSTNDLEADDDKY